MPEQLHDEPFVPPIAKMHFVMYVIVFVVWALIVILNTSTITTDPYFVYGLVMLLFWTYTFEVIVPRAVNRSPKGIGGGTIGTSVTSGKPQKVVGASGAFPEIGIWVSNAIDAPKWSIKNYFAGNGYIMAPMRYSYQFGPNWVWNVDLEIYVDHARLPPHLKAALEEMDEPKYHPDWPVAMNIYPSKVHELSDADRFTLGKELKDLGFLGSMDEIIFLIEKYAATVSPFEYDESSLDVQTLHGLQIGQISKAYDSLKMELRDQQDLTAKWKRASLKPESIQDRSFFAKAFGKEEEEREQT